MCLPRIARVRLGVIYRGGLSEYQKYRIIIRRAHLAHARARAYIHITHRIYNRERIYIARIPTLIVRRELSSIPRARSIVAFIFSRSACRLEISFPLRVFKRELYTRLFILYIYISLSGLFRQSVFSRERKRNARLFSPLSLRVSFCTR